MKFSLSNSLFCCALTWFFYLVPVVVSAQQKSLESPVSLTVVNEPADVALDLLSRNSGLTFTYNPDQLENVRPVTVRMINRPLREILAAILPSDLFGYKITGNQIVLYRLKQDAPPLIKDEPENPRMPVEGILVPDTVFLTRTEIRTDTIVRTDTVLKYDTVYIMRTVTHNNPIPGSAIFPDQTSLPKEQIRDLAVEAGLSLTWYIPTAEFTAGQPFSNKLEQYRSAYSGNLLSGSVNLDLRVKYARFSLETGVSFAGLNQKFNYGYEVKTGGYFLKDTLDIYYTIPEGDTTWFYVLDSTYLPVDVKDFRYKTGIHHKFIEVPLALQYSHPAGRLLIYGKAGIIASVHAGNKGFYILPEEEGVGEIATLETRPVVFSLLLGAGVLFPLNQYLTISTGAVYRRQLQGMYQNFPIETRFSAIGINAGIIYKF